MVHELKRYRLPLLNCKMSTHYEMFEEMSSMKLEQEKLSFDSIISVSHSHTQNYNLFDCDFCLFGTCSVQTAQ